MSPNVKLPHATKQNQLSQALILQGYCQTIMRQQRLKLDELGNVTNAAEIKSIAKKLDETLSRAQDRARSYLDDMQPKLITDTVALRAFVAKAELFPDSVPSDPKNWKQGLDLLVRQTVTQAENALGTKVALERLRDGFLQDTQDFSELAQRMDILVVGEKGALQKLSDELGALQTKIKGLIAATTLGFLAAAVGVLMMVVGALASPFTAGATGALIISGFAVTAGGAAGGGVAAAALKAAYDEQRQKLEDQRRLNGAVRLIEGASAGLKSVAASGATVAAATMEMADAWTTLGRSLEQFKGDLTDQSLQSMRDWWCNTLRADLGLLKTDLNRNLDQLAGVELEEVRNVFLFEHPRLVLAAAA